jgi:MFS transporter, PAT family, beta-lactamase induction signal transducer AmpG
MKWFSRISAVFFTSISSGLPFLLAGSTLQAWYTQAHVNIVAITSLSLVGLPYSLKFLWAPLFDRYALSSRFGRRKSWISCTQLLVAMLLLLMAAMQPAHMAVLLACCALVMVFFSASQDVVVNAFNIELMPKNERADCAFLMSLGYRVGMVVAGPVVYIIASKFSWHCAYVVMALVMMVFVVVTRFLPAELESGLKIGCGYVKENNYNWLAPFLELFKRPGFIWVLFFVLFYKVSDSCVMVSSTPFLLREMHFSLLEVGSIAKTVGLAGVVAGGLVGSLVVKWLKIYRSLFLFALAQGVSNCGFVLLYVLGKSVACMAIVVFVDNFSNGMATVAFVAYLMSCCDRRFTATQYAFLSALMALSQVLIGPVAGIIIKYSNWVDFYIFSVVMILPGLLILPRLGLNRQDEELLESTV